MDENEVSQSVFIDVGRFCHACTKLTRTHFLNKVPWTLNVGNTAFKVFTSVHILYVV
jgi:hypothetical protein